MKTPLLFLLVLLQTAILSGQNRAEQSVPEGKIKGIIIDAESQSPLEFATVSILTEQDSVVITGGITDQKGFFEIQVKPGSYLAKVEFIAYQTSWIDAVVVSKDLAIVNLGIIELSADAAVLDEVEVRAEKSELQMTLDKKVFNVGKDLANTSSNASELLDNVPSVTVDMDGNVSLRGNQGVRILIDGKPSGFGNADGLRSLPANLVDKVEIITNPSARYEAEGMSGILNIVLKKERKSGLNGSFDLNTGYPTQHGASVNLNFRKKKFNLFTNYGFRFRDMPVSDTKYTEFYDGDTTTIIDQFRQRNRKGWSHSIRFGADFFIDKNNTLTGAFMYRIGKDESHSDITYRNYFQSFPENLHSINTRSQLEIEDEPNLEYSLNYKRDFKKKGEELNANIQYRENSEIEDADYEEYFFDAFFEPINRPTLFQHSLTEESSKSWLAQADYVLPIGKEGKFELGYRGSFRRIENNFLVEEFADNEWLVITGLSNDFNYEENINAAYAIIGNKNGKFSYQFGLRAEHSDVLTELLQTNEINDRSYFNLFPSGFLNYELPNKHSIQLSYSKRLRRPGFRDLNPFFSFSDSRNIRRGNPNLDPEFTDSYELNHIKYWEKANISSSLYYRHTEGVFQRIQTVEENDGQLFTISQTENLAVRNAYGLEFVISTEPTKWFRMNTSLNFFRAITDGRNFDENFYADNYSMFGRLNTRTTIAKKYDLQFNFFYMAPNETPQGRRKALVSSDIGVSRDILAGKATLTLNVSDIFNSRKYRFENFDDSFYASGVYRRRVRQIRATFNYRLNQKKRRGGREGRGRNAGPESFEIGS